MKISYGFPVILFMAAFSSLSVPYDVENLGLMFDFQPDELTQGVKVYLFNPSFNHDIKTITTYGATSYNPVKSHLNQYLLPSVIKKVIGPSSKELVFETVLDSRTGIVEIEIPAESTKETKLDRKIKCKIYKSSAYGWKTKGWIPQCEVVK